MQHKIITVKDLLSKEHLKIPNYQRPYKWSTKNVNQLIDDIMLHKDKSAYRLGTLVIHEENNVLYIVDGQQRTLTLTLIAYAMIKHKSDLFKKLNPDYNNINLPDFSFDNTISKYNIQNNYQEIERRIRDFDEHLIYFFFDKCELVQVILSDISEAFQFFDSQNSRGKDLEPHDLLKAFHLREMAHLSIDEQLRSVSTWESMDTQELSNLFSLYLYRIRNWSKGCSARYFTKDDIDIFKGISPDIQEDYPFVQLFKIGHFYIENYNKDYHRNIDNNQLEYPFQIDQTIINGKRFFEMIAHYKTMIDKINTNELHKIAKVLPKSNSDSSSRLEEVLSVLSTYDGRNRTGDRYVRVLFDCCLIYYIDKFGTKNISKAIEKIFIWAYALRLQMQAVQIATIDTYALGNRDDIIMGNKKVFKLIREAIKESDISNIKLDNLNVNNAPKKDATKKIIELFENIGYYDDK